MLFFFDEFLHFQGFGDRRKLTQQRLDQKPFDAYL